ncbi:MAG: fasciclin domain-containing protein [Gammaproteobacteria bacterium]|nr:fasciclin domain-containing protein [Gammaproteobacteria bacterium]
MKNVLQQLRFAQWLAIAALALGSAQAVADDDDDDHGGGAPNTVEVLASTNGAEALVGAVVYVEQSGVLDFSLVDFLSDRRNRFILFAPTNPAFENLLGLDAGSLDGLSSADIANALGGFVPADAVAGILLKHVVPSNRLGWRASETALLRKGSATAADGSELEVGVGATGVTVNDSTIIKANVRTRNSVIHFIDTVL